MLKLHFCIDHNATGETWTNRNTEKKKMKHFKNRIKASLKTFVTV